MNKKTHKNIKSTVQQAFSLVELLISLITISAISAAFVPVITKKLSAERSVNSGVGGGASLPANYEAKLFEFKENQENCNASKNGNNQIPCSITLPENTTTIGVMLASGGGGGGGAGQPRSETNDFNDDTANASSGLKIIPELKNVVIKNLVGAGGAGGGSYSNPNGDVGTKTLTTASGDQTLWVISGMSSFTIASMVGGGGAGGAKSCSRSSAWYEPVNVTVDSSTCGSICANCWASWSSEAYTASHWEGSSQSCATVNGSYCSLSFTNWETGWYSFGMAAAYSETEWCSFPSSAWGGLSCDCWYYDSSGTWTCESGSPCDFSWSGWSAKCNCSAGSSSGVSCPSCSAHGGNGQAGSYLNKTYTMASIPVGSSIILSRGGSATDSSIVVKNSSGTNIFTFNMPAGGTGSASAWCPSCSRDYASCSDGSKGWNSDCKYVKINGSNTTGYANCGGWSGTWIDSTVGTAGKPGVGSSSGGAGGVGYVAIQYQAQIAKNYNGGGGQSGAILKNLIIPADVLKNNINGKIYITKGASVAGGAGSTTTNASSGTVGSSSKVEVKDSSGNLKWSVEVSGGAGGNGGITGDAGTGGSGTCFLKIFNGVSTETYFSRETAVAAGYPEFYCGNTGGAGNIASGATPSTGGTGGTSLYGSYGAGGTGGINGGVGSASTAGRVEMSYQKVFRTPSGGGGGGGAFYSSAEDIIGVTPASTLNILVGGGGTGGAGAGTISASQPPSDGADGAVSSVTVNGYTLSAQAGKGGKKGVTDFTNDTITFGAGGFGGQISHQGKSGADGAQGHYTGISDADTFSSVGGAGGLGGIHAENPVVAPCGGMQIDSTCASSASGSSTDVFSTSTVTFNKLEPNYTSSFVSAGGGGGGYDGSTSGNGGNGQGGFVYIWYRI